MSAADSAWLGMRHRGGGMVIDAILLLDGDLDADQLRVLVRDRLLPRFPALSRRAVPVRESMRALTGLAAWHHVAEPDLGDVVAEVRVAGPLTRETLQAQASALLGRPVDPWTSPWRLDVVRGGDGGAAAIVVRLHHSLGDGVALVAVLDALLDPGAPEPAATGPAAPEPAATWPASTGPGGRDARPAAPRRRRFAGLAVLAAAAAVVPTFVGVVVHAAGRRLPLRGPGGEGTQVAWSRPHDLDTLKAIARSRGVSLNDVLLAAVAGGLRSHLREAGEPARDARVIVPVDLRSQAVRDGRLGNRLGILMVPLPVSVGDPDARVAAVHAVTRRLKRSLQPSSMYLLLGIVGLLPRAVQELAGELLGASADAVVTNVPGPTAERHLAGQPLRSLVFWVPRVGAMTLGISLFSYAGTVSVGVVDRAVGGPGPGRAGALLAAVDGELVTLGHLDDLRSGSPEQGSAARRP